MFSLLNNSNKIDLTQSEAYLNLNENEKKKLLPNLNLINTISGAGNSIIEGYKSSDIIVADDISSQIQTFYDNLNNYKLKYQEMLNDSVTKLSDSLLEEYAGKNIKLEGSNDSEEYYYINKYGYAQKYDDGSWSSRSTSCNNKGNANEVNIDTYNQLMQSAGANVTAGSECGLEGSNVKDNSNYYWIDMKGYKHTYKNSWNNRSNDCKKPILNTANVTNIPKPPGPGYLYYNFQCQQINTDSELYRQVVYLNGILKTEANQILEEINTILSDNIYNEEQIKLIRNDINIKLDELNKDYAIIESGQYDTIQTYNPNIQRLRSSTELSATSNYTRYLVFLFLLILIIGMIVTTFFTNNSKIAIIGIIITIFYIIIMLYTSHFTINV